MDSIDIDLCVVHIRPTQPKFYEKISALISSTSMNWYNFLHDKLTKADGFVMFNQFKDLQLLNGCRDAEFFSIHITVKGSI
jgi:hypothetical protein